MGKTGRSQDGDTVLRTAYCVLRTLNIFVCDSKIGCKTTRWCRPRPRCHSLFTENGGSSVNGLPSFWCFCRSLTRGAPRSPILCHAQRCDCAGYRVVLVINDADRNSDLDSVDPGNHNGKITVHGNRGGKDHCTWCPEIAPRPATHPNPRSS